MKDSLCAYYTDSFPIVSYMLSQLHLSADDILLEPSAGHGAFLECLKSLSHVDAFDVDPDACAYLQEHFSEINVHLSDFLTDPLLHKYANSGGFYTKIVGNPPYGAWQDPNRRTRLRSLFPGQYVKETYSLFLYHAVRLLRPGGRLCFIIPSSFLFLSRFIRLREFLFNSCIIEEVLLFPANLFPGVDFHFADLSIITVERCIDKEKRDSNYIDIWQGFTDASQFHEKSNVSAHYFLKQKSIASNQGHAFLLCTQEELNILQSCQYRLSDIANVVTGFYSGNNSEFYRSYGGKYPAPPEHSVFHCDSIDGIHGVTEGFIPVHHGILSASYLPDIPRYFVRWDKDTVDFYKTDKKARFQNPRFYFTQGIGIPVFSTKGIMAFYMDGRTLFDTSIVGVFPFDMPNVLFLLGLLNSSVMARFMNILRPGISRSAGYVKRLPIILPPPDVFARITTLTEEILSYGRERYDKNQRAIDELVSQLYRLPK